MDHNPYQSPDSSEPQQAAERSLWKRYGAFLVGMGLGVVLAPIGCFVVWVIVVVVAVVVAALGQ